MKVIYKYKFESGEMIQLPANADIIKATKDYFWAVVDDTEEEKLNLKCVIVGTGWPLPEDMAGSWIYLDTFFDDVPYVWHHYLVLKEALENGQE